ncbi:hypothetical protein CRV24_004788 [Beauveria bassiana]|nr:hypothetical protein CRV24_004788 [Beauveria bassiana]
MSNEMERQFVDFYWRLSWNFELLRKDPTLLDTNTISNLEREAYNLLLLPTQLNSDNFKHDVLSTINAAALLKMCAAKPQPEVQKELMKRFADWCTETIREHSKYALNICDRFKQRFDDDDNQVWAPRKMSLEDGEVALDQTIQV